MKIVILDRASIGFDTPISVLSRFGEVVCYDSSSPEEAMARSSDADVIIINKIKVTPNTKARWVKEKVSRLRNFL